MTRLINRSAATPITVSVEPEIPVHIASGTSLVESVRAEAVAHVLETLSLPDLDESGIQNISDSQVGCLIHCGHATAGHDGPVYYDNRSFVQTSSTFGGAT